MRPYTYKITFVGQAGSTLRAQFDDCELTTATDTSAVRANLLGQAALAGLIQRITRPGNRYEVAGGGRPAARPRHLPGGVVP